MKNLFLLLLFCAATVSGARLFEEAELRRTAVPPAIDGQLEALWFDRAVPYNLGDHNGKLNNLIVENYLTIVRLLWDEEYLYAAFVCSTDAVETRFAKRDDPLYESELCELMLAFPGGSRLLELSIAPNGVIYDALVRWNRDNRIEADLSYDIPGLKSAVFLRQPAPGRLVWTAELAIPWKALAPFRPGNGRILRGNLLRYERLSDPELRSRNVPAAGTGDPAYLPLSLFPTQVRGWAAAPSSLGPLRLTE